MLFQKTVLKKYLAALPQEQTQEAWSRYSQYFLNADIQQNILQSKEEQFQEGFLRELFVKVLGYTLNPSPDFNLITEQKNETNAKKADGAILLDGKVIGIIELKDHKTPDLVQQDEWEPYFNDYAAACQTLREQIQETDSEIDRRVFDLYGLTQEEREIVMEN